LVDHSAASRHFRAELSHTAAPLLAYSSRTLAIYIAAGSHDEDPEYDYRGH